GRQDPASSSSNGHASKEVREAVGDAYRELDAGDLSFSLAESTQERSAAERIAQSNWSPVEIGQARAGEEPIAHTRPDPPKPDPQPAQTHANRRPTLIAPVGAPPAHGVPDEYAAVQRIPAPSRTFTVDDAAPPSVRHPVVAVPSPFGPARALDTSAKVA